MPKTISKLQKIEARVMIKENFENKGHAFYFAVGTWLFNGRDRQH